MSYVFLNITDNKSRNQLIQTNSRKKTSLKNNYINLENICYFDWHFNLFSRTRAQFPQECTSQTTKSYTKTPMDTKLKQAVAVYWLGIKFSIK